VLGASLVLPTAVPTRIGVVDLAAHQIAFEVWNFLALALDAVAIAGQALVGTYLGAGDPDEARDAGNRMLQWGLVGGIVVGLAVLALRWPLADVFTNDRDVVALSAFLLLYVAALQPVNGVVFVLDGLLIGAGDMRYLAKAMVGAFVAFAPVALAVWWLGLGIGWLWVAFGVLMAARLAALLARWRAGEWAVVGAT
jgi:Na+-driven multidrug efflux pump